MLDYAFNTHRVNTGFTQRPVRMFLLSKFCNYILCTGIFTQHLLVQYTNKPYMCIVGVAKLSFDQFK